MKNNKQIAIVIFAFSFSVALTTWLSTTSHDEQYTALQKQLEKTNTNLAHFEAAFENLNENIQQLHISVNDNARINNGQLNQFAAVNTEDAEAGDNETPNCNNIATSNIPTNQEIETVTLIVDKLRARDTYAYPDFPTLMSSSEVGDLSPAAMDKMMTEVSRMFENGEIDQSFFPQQ